MAAGNPINAKCLYALGETNPTAAGVRTAKVLSTPEDLSLGVLNALHAAGIPPSGISTIVHGTTVATKALLERKYPEPAPITISVNLSVAHGR
ncbi:hydantoinase/oxoprolinase N-terminal domain-containing protein [Arthrobacter sp. GCM10027362]|uniref:hydantoinase/oxoprolinase N-terminal domain-containing protein n=1 Tax=Arthrobacter sp. GCM10027362 TaxID=3273379 RepID=UPI003625E67F